MEGCQPVDVGVVDVGSLPEQHRHLLPIPGGAGGHKHGSLREADLGPPSPGNTRGVPALRSGPIRLRTQPSLELILPSLFGSFGPGMVSSRHLPWSDSAHGTRRSGVDGSDRGSPGPSPPGGHMATLTRELHTELFSHAAFTVDSEILRQARPCLDLHFLF